MAPRLEGAGAPIEDVGAYRPSPEVVRAQQDLGQFLQVCHRKVSTATHLQGKQVMSDLVLPLVESAIQLQVLQAADILRHIDAVLAADDGGLDPEVAEDLLATVDEIVGLVGPVATALNQGGVGDARKRFASMLDKAVTLLTELGEAIGGLTAEDEEGEDEDEAPLLEDNATPATETDDALLGDNEPEEK